MTGTEEMFVESVGRSGDLAGVFEYDGETGYFYLYRIGDGGSKVLDSIHVLSFRPDFSSRDLEIRWTADDTKVGLLIRRELWAVFDSHQGTKYGGDYRSKARPDLPAVVREGFAPSS